MPPAVPDASGHLAAIISSSDDAIVSKSLDGIIITWNGAAERLFGYASAEAVGRHISLIIPKDRLPEENYVIERIRAGLGVDHYETVRQRKDGSMIDISLTVSPTTRLTAPSSAPPRSRVISASRKNCSGSRRTPAAPRTTFSRRSPTSCERRSTPSSAMCRC